MSEKNILKLNFDFIVAEIRGVFGSVGVYACVCEWKSWPLLFFVQQRPNLNDIRGHSDPKNICQIARNRIYFFKMFWGRTPGPRRRARFGALPPYWAPFPKFLDPPLVMPAFNKRNYIGRNSYSLTRLHNRERTRVSKGSIRAALECS